MSSIKLFSKNILRTLLMAFCLIALSVAMTACGDEAKITLIKVDTTASVLTVEQGGTIDDLNIVVKGYYDDGKEISIDVDDKALTFSELNTTQAGVFPLTVSYTIGEGDKAVVLTDQVNVTVAKKAKSIAFATNDGLPAYVNEGQTVDYSNLKLTVTYIDDTTADVTYNRDLMTVTLNTSTEGKITVVVAYKGLTQTISKDVTIKTVTEITSVTINDKFYQYQPASFANTTINVNYSTNESATLDYSTQMTVSGLDVTTAGEQTVTLSYAGKTKQTTVDVIGIKTGAGIESIKYVSGLPNEINQGTNLNYSNLVISVLYDDAADVDDCTSKNLAYNAAYMNVAFEANAAEVGLHSLTISLKLNATDFVETEFVYEVLAVVEQDEILGFEDPAFVTAYNNVKLNTFDTTGSNGVKGFAVAGDPVNNPYLVGSQNAWFYKPIAHAEADEPLATYATNVEVYMDGSTTPLTKEQLLEYFDDTDWYATQMYDFSEDANGHTFRIVVRPYGQVDDDLVSSFTFDVIDAYNVYNARDLSVFDNTNDDSKWTTLKQQWGIALNTDVHSIVLQDNVSITRDVVPDGFFWTRDELTALNLDENDINAMVGSFKDNDSNNYGYIYKRIQNPNADDKPFRFEGNYFTISAQNLPLIKRDDGGKSVLDGNPITVHSTVFGFYGGDQALETTTKYEINNVEFFGNAQKSEDVRQSGGIICFKKKDCDMTVNNVFSQCWFISLFQREGRDAADPETGDALSERFKFTLNKVNAYDANNTLIYNWGGKIYINDSHLIGAGGPVMICDQTSHGNTPETTGTISNVIVNNSVLESWVAGTENWFVGYDATELAGQMKALDQLLAGIGQMTSQLHQENAQIPVVNKTFVKGEKINLIAVYKSGSEAGLTTVNIRGKFSDVTTDGNGNPIFTNGLDLPMLTEIIDRVTDYQLPYYVQDYLLSQGANNMDEYVTAVAGVPYDQLTDEQYNAIADAVTANVRTTLREGVASNFEGFPINQAIVLETFNSAMVIPSGVFSSENPADFFAFPDVSDLSNSVTMGTLLNLLNSTPNNGKGYLNVYIFNGMGAVLSLENRSA